MKKYVFYSKILEDIRTLEERRTESGFAKRIRVSILRKTEKSRSDSLSGLRCFMGSRETGSVRGWVLNFIHGKGVFFREKYKKMRKQFKIPSFCPLIISTREDTMINNMVLSREIEWIGYEHKRNMLQVEFIVGSIYQYENVPETVYQEFLTAPSHGRFFESNIKNKYQVRKVR